MKIQIVGARCAFAQGLFTASAFEEGQTPKFGADFLLVPGAKVYEITGAKGALVKTPTTMEKAMLKVANEAWKGKGKEVLAALEPSKKSYRNGDLRMTQAGDPYDGYEGLWYVTAKSAARPTIIDRDKTPLTEADGKPYSGCYVAVSFDIYANTKPKTKGVFAGLKGVQFLKDGDAFGGGAPADPDEFEDLGVEDEESEEALA